MESNLFKTIYSNLESRVTWCDSHLGTLKGKADLENLTLKDYQEVLKGSKKLMSDMDKIYTEINHIYGMGNLTVQQQSKLVAMMKRFTSYRTDLKCLASHSDASTTPSLSRKSTYKLSVLADKTLVNDNGVYYIAEEKEIKDKIEAAVKEAPKVGGNNKLPYNIVNSNGKDILEVRFDTYDGETVDQVKKELSLITGEAIGKRKNFLKQVCKLGEHYKVDWDVEGPGKIVGRLELNNKYWPIVKSMMGMR